MSDVPMTTLAKAGRYEIVGELGRGAMGVVYKATHPNIVVVFDAGEEDGLYYITMELVEGRSVQALLDDGHSFPLPRVLRIMEQACSALQFAHERNVVHRDIKPANLMLTGDDTVKVTDFGTAKILQFGTVQQTAHVMGTPSYMSPEQVKGRAVDGRSDIFSLGVMLYEMVTGEKPFPGQSITTVIYKIVNEEPVPPRQIDPSIHPGISAIVMKALVKEPDQRYQNCREMLEDLRDSRSPEPSGGNPQSTMVMGGGSPAATLISGNATGRGFTGEDQTVIATARSLNARASAPGQTPLVRRTGAIARAPEPPKKKNVLGTFFAALLLLGVIVYGAYRIKPVFEAARELHDQQKKGSSLPAAAPAASKTSSDNSTASAAGTEASRQPTDPAAGAGAEPKPAGPKPAEIVAEKVAPKKAENSLSPKAAEYKGRIEAAISERRLSGHVKVQAAGNTLTLAGKLRPAEHGALLKLLRNAPSDVRVIDHLEYDDTPVATGHPDEGSHPVPAAGRGAIHVVTDVIGATAGLG